ncbi:MAG: plasmid partitioning protein RepB C-terminal domain-containing protein [Terrimicrobiaceae bacterium]
MKNEPTSPKVAFEMRVIQVPLDALLPTRHFNDVQKKGFVRYRTILASIREVGLIEPLSVSPQKGKTKGTFFINDGHIRYYALKELKVDKVSCIVAKEDESYTYNSKVSRLCPIQENAMIMKAIGNGVSPEKIARTLNISIKTIRSHMGLLDGIHAEAVEMLKDKHLNPAVFWVMKKVKPMRQMEMAEMMIRSNTYTKPYAEALLAGTPKDQLLNPEQPKKIVGLKPEDVARMEAEMEIIERDFKLAENNYSDNVLHLTLIRGYIKKLVENERVAKFLTKRYAEIFGEFQAVAALEAL